MTPRPTPTTPGLVGTGRDLFIGSGACYACHTIEGISQGGVLGPDLTNIGSVAAERIPGYTAEEYIRESIVDPCAYTAPHVESCELMDSTLTSFISLSEEEIDALVAFLLEQK